MFKSPVKDIVMRITSAGKEMAEIFAKIGVVGLRLIFQSPELS